MVLMVRGQRSEGRGKIPDPFTYGTAQTIDPIPFWPSSSELLDLFRAVFESPPPSSLLIMTFTSPCRDSSRLRGVRRAMALLRRSSSGKAGTLRQMPRDYSQGQCEAPVSWPQVGFPSHQAGRGERWRARDAKKRISRRGFAKTGAARARLYPVVYASMLCPMFCE